jgi:FlaA1/EpsC-like NDP-sugar epimerase
VSTPRLALMPGRMVSRALNSSEKLIYTLAAQLLIDVGIVAVALAAAYLVRFDGPPPREFLKQGLFVLPYVVVLYLGGNYLWRVYTFVWRFTGVREVLWISGAVVCSGLLLFLGRLALFEAHYTSLRMPYGVLILHPLLAGIGMIVARGLRRIQYQYTKRRNGAANGVAEKKRVLLVGAGEAGVRLAQELTERSDFLLIGFADDDPRKRGQRISGLRVLGRTSEIEDLVEKHQVHNVVLCMPSAPQALVRQIALRCRQIPVKVFTVPPVSEILLGHVAISSLRPVQMTDLLGRAAVEYNSKDFELVRHYRGKRVMVTGAAGSIGSELARQLRYFKPSEFILLDKDESGLYEIALEVREDFDGKVHEVVADVQNLGRLGRIFSRTKPQVVFHAAAYKHVPMMERHPSEAILNNVVGTRNVVQLCQVCGVKSFVLISTDKAVNPTNVMGASKRLAEMVVQEAACKNGCSYCCVRFGNVLGSRGSVVPLFQKRIQQGKSLRVTHPDIVRYFMTIPEAVQLVIQAGSLGRKGEIFVLDMGDPVKIRDLATELIELSGLVPDVDIKIEFTGLRPGEKLYEELLVGEGSRSTRYPKIFVEQAIDGVWNGLDETLQSLQEAAVQEDVGTIYRVLREMGIGYHRDLSTADNADITRMAADKS